LPRSSKNESNGKLSTADNVVRQASQRNGTPGNSVASSSGGREVSTETSGASTRPTRQPTNKPGTLGVIGPTTANIDPNIKHPKLDGTNT
jgi:hypothetical protein